MEPATQVLLSLPPRMCHHFARRPAAPAGAFCTHDPPDVQLGSGGGTAYLLSEAWRASQSDRSLEGWLEERRCLAIHGGGESRRLPAYASCGKLFIPLPIFRWSRGQRLGQTLLDLNRPFLEEVLERAHPAARLLVASGDVLLRARTPLARLPDADVVLLGMWASPEEAQHYGVMFCDRRNLTKLTTFAQKPLPDEIRDRSRHHPFLIDIGVWLLRQQAVECLLKQCGWDSVTQTFVHGVAPQAYDLYGEWALQLGEDPMRDGEASRLTVAVATVDQGEFYHFGTTQDLVESMYALQNVVQDQTMLGPVPSLAQPKQFIQDAAFEVPLRRQENDALWVEGSHIPASWSLSKRHVLTGVPENSWDLTLREGVCLDFVPYEEQHLVVRAYGYTDHFRGSVSHPQTTWIDQPAVRWFGDRCVTLEEAGLDPEIDIQLAPLFPILDATSLSGGFLQWLTGGSPSALGPDAATHRRVWLESPRMSARQINQEANLDRMVADRRRLRHLALPVMASHARQSVFYKLDLAATAKEYATCGQPLPQPLSEDSDVMLAVHERMFRSEVRRLRGDGDWREDEREAFRLMAKAIVAPYAQARLIPTYRLAADQIVWARSPARVDLAGGWTDTPPYCLEHGGSVVNIALTLNGQPPIQAFARRSDEFSITVRSIDLGASESVLSYEQVGEYRNIGSGFSVAKAALALCGFHPDFNGAAYDSLHRQLEAFGGGVDLSMLAAIPKGSGLGTSSILAGTVLAALGKLCGFHWDTPAIARRVTAVEQMLGSGGGWQDQMGGLLGGAKLIETPSGLAQTPSVRWLPSDFFSSREFRSRSLLYYTGITRTAYDVLGEIVRGMFLNDPDRLAVLDQISRNSQACFDAVQRFDLPGFLATIQTSWRLNQELDTGTNPEHVARLMDRIKPYTSAYKLAGAGGGGFIYIIAKDAEQAVLLRRELSAAPPNERARFVEMDLSSTGLQVTTS